MRGEAALGDERIRLRTQFGDFTADASSLVFFPIGLAGFEGCRRFAVLSSAVAAPLQCLHAVDGTAASFLALDPRLVLPAYRCEPNATDMARLRAATPERLLWLSLLCIDGHGHAFANLRAPIVINPDLMVGYQLMPHDTLYPLRHPVTVLS